MVWSTDFNSLVFQILKTFLILINLFLQRCRWAVIIEIENLQRQLYTFNYVKEKLNWTMCFLFWDWSFKNLVFFSFKVRVYTPKRVVQELEAAKEEYIRATFGVRKDKKILLPKIVESFAKDSGLCPAGVLEMIQQTLPESLRKSVKKSLQAGKSRKTIEWIPHNFAFRYLIFKELVKWKMFCMGSLLFWTHSIICIVSVVFITEDFMYHFVQSRRKQKRKKKKKVK